MDLCWGETLVAEDIIRRLWRSDEGQIRADEPLCADLVPNLGAAGFGEGAVSRQQCRVRPQALLQRAEPFSH